MGDYGKRDIKIITLYLPQFHVVPENSVWWGEGFTEWTAVKRAKPLFSKHKQPKIPLNKNYYNLLNKEVMINQQSLMQQYNIYGQCFYHYWFKGGRKILEKPAENLLSWTDIDMPFCFSWANQTWARTWSNISGSNTWAAKFEKSYNRNEKECGVLLEQDYGTESDWSKHFFYLLPFFQDKRYIKIDGKPVFLFFKPNDIPCINEMLSFWNELAFREGIPGIYAIAHSHMAGDVIHPSVFNAIYYHEPQRSMEIVSEDYIDGIKCYDYDTIWHQILREEVNIKQDVFLGAAMRWDNTPRQGEKGSLIVNSTPEKFERYLSRLIQKSKKMNSPFVFINAWNEWGEGMYLEPDEEYGYAYLEAVRRAQEEPLETVTEEICSVDWEKEKQALICKNYMFRERSEILNQWLWLKENGLSLSSFFQKRDIKRIALYGIGILGRHVIAELQGSDIEIKYGIDRAAKVINREFPVYTLEDELPEIDVIVVTITDEFLNIKKNLSRKIACPIISLREVVFSVGRC